MQFKNIGFRVPGLYSAASLALREANMSTTAKQRRKALVFWRKHGLAAALDYAGVCRATLYAWRAAQRKRGVAGLSGKRRAPKQTRRRNWPPALLKMASGLNIDAFIAVEFIKRKDSDNSGGA